MIRLCAMYLLLTFVSAPSLANNTQADALISQALETYAQAQATTERTARLAVFGQAERLFVQALQVTTPNANLYANAGIAALQSERLGPAVLAFRRALAVAPAHPTAIRNLAHARSLLPAWVPKQGAESVFEPFFFWHRSTSHAARMGAAAVSFFLTALALAIAIAWRSTLARGVGALLGVIWIALLASVLVESLRGTGHDAVITADEAIARASDSVNAPARFAEPLPAGTEVTVIESRERWARIRLANNREAWINRASLELL